MVDSRGDYAVLGRTRIVPQWIKTSSPDPIKLTVDSLNNQFIEATAGVDVFVPLERIDGLWYNFSALGAGGLTIKTPKVPAVLESEPGLGDDRPEVPEFTLLSVGAGKSEVITCIGGLWRGDGVALQPPPPESDAMKKQRVLDERRMAEAAAENERLKKEEERLLALADMTPEERKKAEAEAAKVRSVAGQQGAVSPTLQPAHPQAEKK